MKVPSLVSAPPSATLPGVWAMRGPAVGRDVVAVEVLLAVTAQGVDRAADVGQAAAPGDVDRHGRQRRPGIRDDVVAEELLVRVAPQEIDVRAVCRERAALLDVVRRARQRVPGAGADVVALEDRAAAHRRVDLSAVPVQVDERASLPDVRSGWGLDRPGVRGDVVRPERLRPVSAEGVDRSGAVGRERAALLDRAQGDRASRPGAGRDVVLPEGDLVAALEARRSRPCSRW